MLVAPRRRVPSAGGVLACMAALTVASCASGPISQLEQPALRATELGAMHLRGGSAAVLVPTIQRQGSQYQLVPDEEVLGSHKASLRASAQRPELLNRAAMKAAPKAAPTLSLVRPTFQKEEDGGKNGTVEEGKKFQAFKGTGQTILTQEQVKDTMGSSSTMHKLAIERLQRLKSQSATAEGEESIAEAEAALRRYETTHLTRPVSAVSGPVEARSDVMIARLKRMDAEQFGETTGVDDNGHTWVETWTTDPLTKVASGQRSGSTWTSTWTETLSKSAIGDLTVEGVNTSGDKWGEKCGTHANGTTWREKWLHKLDGYVEELGWNSAGQHTGFRMGQRDDGEKWVESWVQVEKDGIVKGILEGENVHGDLWKEEWENTQLNAINEATGEQLMSRCGKKSGNNRDGKQWTEAWGTDDIYGQWGTRHELCVDGTEWTEHWGSNAEGDKWCAKWGVNKLGLGVTEEWGFKNGEKKLRVGQEMDGETNMEEGKIETWTEQWCKTFEDDGRLAHTHAEKVGDNGFGDRWNEKWDELYNTDGSNEKWASKRGAKDRTSDVWHEQWGERRGGPEEGEDHGKFESCWAEQEGTNGYGERWHNGWSESLDPYGGGGHKGTNGYRERWQHGWSESLDPYGGGGHKVCNKFKKLANGSEMIERSGEEWDGKGWFQKGGETVHNGGKVDGWHEQAW